MQEIDASINMRKMPFCLLHPSMRIHPSSDDDLAVDVLGPEP